MAVNSKQRKYLGYRATELVDGLIQIGINDQNKKKARLLLFTVQMRYIMFKVQLLNGFKIMLPFEIRTVLKFVQYSVKPALTNSFYASHRRICVRGIR